MLKLFSGNRTIVLLLLPLFLGLFHFLNITTGFYTKDSNLFGYWDVFFKMSTFNTNFFAALLVLINAIVLNRIFNKSNFFDRITYLIAPCYVVFISFFGISYSLNGVLLAHLFLILMLQQLFNLNQNEARISTVFNIMLLGGLACSVLPVLLFILPFMLGIIRFMRPLSFRDIMVGILASVLPYFYHLSAIYLLDWPSLDVSFYAEKSMLRGDWPVVLGILFFASIIGLAAFITQWQKSAIRSKRQFQMLLVLFIVLLLISIFYLLSFQQISLFSLLLLPLCLLLPFAFRSETLGMASSGVFYLLLSFSVIKFFIFS